MMHIIARRCIPLRLGAIRCAECLSTGSEGTCTTQAMLNRQFARLGTGARLPYGSSMDQNLGRPPAPYAKSDRSLPPTAEAAPAAFDFVHPQVVGGKRMTIAASAGYGCGLAYAIAGKAHQMSFGCFKARPRYHLRWAIPDCDPLRPSILR
jgi:hypothetical protein